MKEKDNLGNLIDSVTKYGKWLERFNEAEYPDAFQDYYRAYRLPFTRALNANGVPDVLDYMANGIWDNFMETKHWKLGGEMANVKLIMISYLFPMLLMPYSRFQELFGDSPELFLPETGIHAAGFSDAVLESENGFVAEEMTDACRELCEGLGLLWNKAYPNDTISGAEIFEEIANSFCHKLFGMDIRKN